MPAGDDPKQLVFAGVDAVSPMHLVPGDEVAAATNIDFSLVRGAAAVRRGNVTFASPSSSAIKSIFRFQNNPNDISAGPYYVGDGAGAVKRGTGGGSYSTIASAGATDMNGYAAYRNFAYIASGTNNIKDDGTNTTDWIKQAPTTFTAYTINTDTLVLSAITTFTTSEGTYGGVTSGTYTGTSDSITNRLQFFGTFSSGLGTSIDLSTNASRIGPYGADTISVAVDNPSVLTKVSWDYSIADKTFSNYWHTELFPGSIAPASTVDVQALINQIIAGQHGINFDIDFDSKIEAISRLNQTVQQVLQTIGDAKTSITPWTVPRPVWEFVGNRSVLGTSVGADLWSDIQAIRLVFEGDSTFAALITPPAVFGDDSHPLNDVVNGYTYWRTYATLDGDGNVIGESAPGSATGPIKTQYSAVTMTASAFSLGTSGITHQILYRQGGLAQVPYAVGTFTATQTTLTDTMPDIVSVANNSPLTTFNNLHKTDWFGDVIAISEPYYSRLFLGHENKISWTLPGQPDVILKSNNLIVTYSGDSVVGFVNWDRLIVITRDGVYELGGTIFEGPSSDFVLQKSGSKHGGKAKRTLIKTPYGVPLLDYDGLYMYVPGQGIDAALDWFNIKVGDIFRGYAASDPGALKGNRIQPVTLSYLQDASAAYWDGKLYLAVPTGGDTTASVVYVAEFMTKKVWMYKYPFAISSMLWDATQNRLLAGTTDGKLRQLEFSTQDDGIAISWYVKTRAWTSPSDTMCETLSTEFQGGGTCVVTADIDGTSTKTLGTLTSTRKHWENLPVHGTIVDSIDFVWTGIQTGSGLQNVLSGLDFDLVQEPKRLTYYRTEPQFYQNPDAPGQPTDAHPAEAYWDTHFAEIEILNLGTSSTTQTVTAVTFVDGVAVMSNTFIGPTVGRLSKVNAFPAETYGSIVYTTYTSTDTNYPFKLWSDSHNGRPEPPRVNTWKTEVFDFKNETWWQRMHGEVNPLGTALATVVIDNASVGTYTLTGTLRAQYPFALPSETYGKLGYIRYNSVGGVFKHYNSWFDRVDEPDRVLFYETDVRAIPSENYAKTWVPELNPLGGTVTGTTLFEGTNGTYTAVSTETFTGSLRHRYEIGHPNVTTGKTIKATYTSPTVFKHYGTDWELQPKPFGKKTWLLTYHKPGGFTQLDMVRFWAYDIETHGTATITSTWLVDGIAFTTDTTTVVGRQYKDQISWPPGGRGYLFEHQMTSSADFKVWKSNLDIERVGVKGFNRVTAVGTPHD